MHYRSQLAIGSGLFTLAFLFTSPAHALPDARQGSPLAQNPSGVGAILRDHEIGNALYVAPSNSRDSVGTYAQLDATDCDNFARIYGQTYRLPPDINTALQTGAFISNYFQLTAALPFQNRSATNEILRIRGELRGQEDELRLQVRNPAVEERWQQLQAEVTRLDALIAQLGSLPSAAVLECVSNPVTAIACMTDLAAAQNRKVQAAEQQRAAVQAEVESLRAAYEQSVRARHTIESLEVAIRDNREDLGFWELVRSAQAVTSQAAFDLEERVLRAERDRVVGRASVGYNLFDDEVTRTQQALAASGQLGFQLTELPVFNVRLNMGGRWDNPLVPSAADGAEVRPYVYTFQEGTLLSAGVALPTDLTLDAAGTAGAPPHRLYYSTWDAHSFASGGFDMYVTQGGRCGNVTTSSRAFTPPGAAPDEPSQVIAAPVFEPQRDAAVFAKSIGLSYNFYAYPGPIEGDCEINVDRMNDYWREAGKKKSWRWFRTYTTSWDNTRQEMRETLGLDCHLTQKPVSNDPIEAERLSQQVEQQMYDEMWKLFLTVYAKSYEIKAEAPSVDDPGRSTVGATIGGGLMSICGANLYCQIGNVVLKTLDELGGSRAQGTTSSYSHIYGTISKHFSRDTWAVREGSSLINLRVCVDRTRC